MMPTSKNKEQVGLVFEPSFARDLRAYAAACVDCNYKISKLVQDAVEEYVKNHSDRFKWPENLRMMTIEPE